MAACLSVTISAKGESGEHYGVNKLSFQFEVFTLISVKFTELLLIKNQGVLFELNTSKETTNSHLSYWNTDINIQYYKIWLDNLEIWQIFMMINFPQV